MGRKKRAKRPKQVRVVWLDAQADVTLHGTLEDVLKRAKLAIRESSGWLLRYDDSVTVICRDYDAPDLDEPTAQARYGDVQTMPSGWVRGVYEGNREVKRERSEPVAQASGGGVEGSRTGEASERPGARPTGADSLPETARASAPSGN